MRRVVLLPLGWAANVVVLHLGTFTMYIGTKGYFGPLYVPTAIATRRGLVLGLFYGTTDAWWPR